VSDFRIAIVLGSTRPGRKGKDVADWVADKAAAFVTRAMKGVREIEAVRA
jgi:NAD(P)H-dependent FMN reductase